MNKYFAYLLSVVILCSVITACSKKNDEPVVNTDKKTQNDSPSVKSNKKVNDRPVSDTVYFGMWNGKQIIIDDYYKYAANEKLTNDNTGEGYEKYGGDFKALLQKLGVYDEKKVNITSKILNLSLPITQILEKVITCIFQQGQVFIPLR